MSKAVLKPENIAQFVFFLRGEKVMLDADLAKLYGVTTKALNQAVKRNKGRFPKDFMFQLSKEEATPLRSQIVISKQSGTDSNRSQIVTASITRARNRSQFVTGSQRHRDPRLLPYAFTEQGVAMLSSVLRSSRAVEVNIAIMRTFVQLRRLMDSNADLARKIQAMENKYDEQFAAVFDAIKQLIAEDQAIKAQPRRRIGFNP
ncbi:MAG: ORF6N domain-containing protein [Verrucomicrobiota bacterium]|nr:ORF6N domain-containing protein [Verrucomicrobiota bacterium]